MSANTLSKKNQTIKYAHLVYNKRWVANHDGNLTQRLDTERVLATPTSFSKGDVTAQDLIVVDMNGKRLSGRQRPFSEFALHAALYRARPDACAVIHAHPPFATAMAVAGLGMDRPFLAEAVVSLGDRIPLIPFSMPKSPEWTQDLEHAARLYDAFILENHGVITLGKDLEQAFLRLELVEHLAEIFHKSLAFGGPRTLNDAQIHTLLDARKRAGLGPEARGLQRPSLASNAALQGPKPQPSRTQLAALIRAELQNLSS